MLFAVITAFQRRHQISVVSDAGMLSAANLSSPVDAGLSFIVGSHTTKAAKALDEHFGLR